MLYNKTFSKVIFLGDICPFFPDITPSRKSYYITYLYIIKK